MALEDKDCAQAQSFRQSLLILLSHVFCCAPQSTQISNAFHVCASPRHSQVLALCQIGQTADVLTLGVVQGY